MIPAFDINGVVPPILPGEAGASSRRAPYATDMLTFCLRFGTSQERCSILRGLLDLRDALRGAGVAVGFQWINGSFTEDVERLEGRAPADVDVVTFCAFGDAARQRHLLDTIPEAFVPLRAKQAYKVDHYFVQTDASSDREAAAAELARQAAYWYSLWAHQRRTLRWKGFVSIALESSDAPARAWLDQHAPHAGGVP